MHLKPCCVIYWEVCRQRSSSWLFLHKKVQKMLLTPCMLLIPLISSSLYWKGSFSDENIACHTHCDLWKVQNTIYSRLQSLPLVLPVTLLLLPLSLPFSLNLPHSFVSPLSLFAPAPPYNHAGSWLSFGVVYIAVIVRVQYGDWAEHVYSLTGLFCNKSHSGEESVGGWGSCTCTSTCTHTKTHSLKHNAQTIQ